MAIQNLSNDVLFNQLNVKFPVEIKRNTHGKKDCKFPMKWKNIIDNACIGGFTDNIAFRTGKVNDITVLDFDDLDSVNWFEKNVAKIEDLKCHRVKTKQGIHLYFKYSAGLDYILAKRVKSKVKVIKCIDVRSEGNCIFYGKGYTLEKFESNLQHIPSKFFDHVKITEPNKKLEPVQSIIDFKISDDDVEMLLNGLSVSRCINYNDWIKVAICLKNSFGDLYKEYWIQWSKKSPEHEFDKNTIECYWDNIKKGPATINSLYFMLREDNPKVFNLLCKKKSNIIKEATKDLIFNDYRKYLNKLTTVDEVEFFLTETVRRVVNNGLPVYALKVIDQHRDIRWEVVKNFPLSVCDVFKYETKNLSDSNSS